MNLCNKTVLAIRNENLNVAATTSNSQLDEIEIQAQDRDEREKFEHTYFLAQRLTNVIMLLTD